jgi:hypothetical protein
MYSKEYLVAQTKAVFPECRAVFVTAKVQEGGIALVEVSLYFDVINHDFVDSERCRKIVNIVKRGWRTWALFADEFNNEECLQIDVGIAFRCVN